MDWQSGVAGGIALLAAAWAGKMLVWPWISEFRKGKAPDAGCGGCGSSGGACASEKKQTIPSDRNGR